MAVGCAACLISACTQADGRAYLAASEIRRHIVGNGSVVRRPLTTSAGDARADQWKERFLPSNTDATQGTIRGRGRFDLPWTGTWSIDGDSICLEYEGGEDGCYRLAREEGDRVLWFDGAGALAFESYLVEADESEGVAAEPMAPPFPREAVTFRHGADTLAGELNLPSVPPPHPAILFVEGAGAESHHGSSPISDEFLRRGFATLIWSKPGVDESTGDWRGQSMDDRAGEVEAAMSYLATRADIDPDRIGLFGGSQAGWVVPKVAAHREVAFMILQSCPAQSAMSQMLYAAESVLALLEIPEAERPRVLDRVRSYYELIRASKSHEEFLRGQESLLGEVKESSWYAELQRPPTAPEAWFLASVASDPRWFFRFGPIDREMFQFLHGMFVEDAPPRLEYLRSPVLAIYGTKDILVDWKLGATAYQSVPEAAGNPDVTVMLFEGADHVLVQPDREGYLDYAPGYLTTMGEWLSKQR